MKRMALRKEEAGLMHSAHVASCKLRWQCHECMAHWGSDHE